MITQRRAAGVAVACALAVSACGGSPAEPATTATGPSPTATGGATTATGDATTTTTTDAGTPAATDTGSASPTATDTAIDVRDVTEQAEGAGQVTFTSPTGNIVCSIYSFTEEPSAECWLDEADWTVPEPEDCEFDWLPHALHVGETSTVGACVSDYPHAPERSALPYGQGLRVRDVVCESRESGVTCSNTETGHGFHAARASYRTF